MKLERKHLWLAILCPALMLTGAGCGGLNASHSVSPASFFLPGLLQNDPVEETVPPVLKEPQPTLLAVNLQLKDH